ncbi:hypothetical protein Q1695_004834 [Nippostrongylus brasiliensis]|nr:hypothetical protein Q1695_004834 [Nippostrongylus brasiliensis]
MLLLVFHVHGLAMLNTETLNQCQHVVPVRCFLAEFRPSTQGITHTETDKRKSDKITSILDFHVFFTESGEKFIPRNWLLLSVVLFRRQFLTDGPMSQRSIIVVRHGERFDYTFNTDGSRWTSKVFDSEGKYTPCDLNMPKTVPKRKDDWKTANDTPLTVIGRTQATLTGNALKEAGVSITAVYCSPALRSVQTACGIVEGYGFSELISVEPGLHEWMQWTRYHRPTFMEPIELHENGYPIDTDYKPIIELRELSSTETLEEFYDRGYSVVKQLLERHSSGAILLAAHGDMPDCCTRKLCGGEPRPFDDFFALVKRTPFLGCVQAVEEQDGSWKIGPSPIPPLTHMDNGTYDSQQLCRPVPPMDDEMRNDIPPWMKK